MKAKKRKLSVILLLGVIAVVFVAYFYTKSDKDLYSVAIAQYIDHPGLDAVRKGFYDQMSKLGYIENKSIKYDYQNCQGDGVLTQNISNKFSNGNYDVIFSIATPITQALKKGTSKNQKPIVFGAITDPISAGLVSSLENPKENLTGTSDVWPYYKQLELIKRIMPNVQRVGVLFNPGEANTTYAMEQTRSAAKELGFELIEAPITGINEIRTGILNIANKVDAFYVTADNTTMAGASAIVKTATEKGIPVFAGDPGTFDAGCVAGLGVSYYNLGVANANMVNDILKNGKKTAEIPIVVSDAPELMVNLLVAQKLNVTIPNEIIESADKLIR